MAVPGPSLRTSERPAKCRTSWSAQSTGRSAPQVLDLRLLHRAVESGPVGIAQVLGDDEVHSQADGDCSRVTEPLLGPAVPALDDTIGVSLDHGVRVHDAMIAPLCLE